MTKAVDRAAEWFIIAMFLLFAMPAMWAALPPSDTKSILMAIMIVSDVYFWISPVIVFIEWINGFFGGS